MTEEILHDRPAKAKPTKPQSILRTDGEERGYTKLSNKLLQHPTISDDTLGMQVRLLSHGATWQITMPGLIRASSGGKAKVRKQVKESMTLGFMRCFEFRDANGRVTHYLYIASDNPERLAKFVPPSDCRELGDKPVSENRIPADRPADRPESDLREAAEREAANRNAYKRTDSEKGQKVERTVVSEAIASSTTGAQAREVVEEAGISTAPIFDDQEARQEVQTTGPARLALPADTLEMAHNLICGWPCGPGKRKVMRPEQSRAMVELMLKPFAADGELALQALEIALATLANQALDAESVKTKGPKGAIAYLHGCLKRMIPEMKRDAAINAAKVNGVVARENAKTQGVVSREGHYTGVAAAKAKYDGAKFEAVAGGGFDPTSYKVETIHGCEISAADANELLAMVRIYNPGADASVIRKALREASALPREKFGRVEKDAKGFTLQRAAQKDAVMRLIEENLATDYAYARHGKPETFCGGEVFVSANTDVPSSNRPLVYPKVAFSVQFGARMTEKYPLAMASISGMVAINKAAKEAGWSDYGPGQQARIEALADAELAKVEAERAVYWAKQRADPYSEHYVKPKMEAHAI